MSQRLSHNFLPLVGELQDCEQWPWCVSPVSVLWFLARVNINPSEASLNFYQVLEWIRRLVNWHHASSWYSAMNQWLLLGQCDVQCLWLIFSLGSEHWSFLDVADSGFNVIIRSSMCSGKITSWWWNVDVIDFCVVDIMLHAAACCMTHLPSFVWMKVVNVPSEEHFIVTDCLLGLP